MQIGSKPGNVPLIRPRERLRLVIFCLGTVLFIALWLSFYRGIPAPGDGTGVVIDAVEVNLERPDLASLAAVPTDLSVQAAQTADWEADPEALASALLYMPIDDPQLLAWAQSRVRRDREERVIPQGMAIADLARMEGGGAAVLVGGSLCEVVALGGNPDAADPRDWLALTVSSPAREGGEHFLVALVQRSAVVGEAMLEVGGDPVRLSGRLLGQRRLAIVGSSDPDARTRVPVVVAGMVVQGAPAADVALPQLPGVGVPDTRFQGLYQADPTVYAEIDDHLRPVLEQRPYYQLLGQLRADASMGPFTQAADGLALAYQLHKSPQDHRGEVVAIHGVVWDAWWDTEVARDRPWDIRQVQRIRCFRRVYGVEHEVESIDGKVTTSTEPRLHAYEVAVLCSADRPLPRTGEIIEVTGRFLKVLGYPIQPNEMGRRELGIKTQSELAYFKFLVANDYIVHPAPTKPDFGWIMWGFFIISASFIGFMVILVQRDGSQTDDLKRGAHKLRANRRKLDKKRKAPTQSAADAEGPGATPPVV